MKNKNKQNIKNKPKKINYKQKQFIKTKNKTNYKLNNCISTDIVNNLN